MNGLRGMCFDQPSAQWNTFHRDNPQAFRLCAICPLPAVGACGPHLQPVGLIVAGVAYDDKGRPLVRCAKCGYPMPRRKGYLQGVCTRGACPDGRRHRRKQAAATAAAAPPAPRPDLFQAEITRLTLAGVRRAEIARQLQLSPRGVRAAQQRWGLTGVALEQALANANNTTTDRKAS